MHVRVADNRDLQGIGVLLRRSYPVLMKRAYAPDVLALALPLMTQANPDLVSSGRFYVAEDGGAIVGCGGWSFFAPGTGATVDGLVHARHFAVDPDRVGTGVGRAIFDRSAMDAPLAGAIRMQAFSSLNAEPFYRKMGLQRRALIEIPIGPGVAFPAILMDGPLCPSRKGF